ncbi:MAG: hypothetical protein ACFFCS_22435 [Candidatus Hodarchaeota archaeon]
MGFIDDFLSIGVDSFWASDGYTVFATALVAVALVISLALSFKLFAKYRLNKKKSVRYLALAYLLIIIGILLAIPIALDPACHVKKSFENSSKMVIIFAVYFYFSFAISIFYMKDENKKKIVIIQALYLIINIFLVIMNAIFEISHCIIYGETLQGPVFALIQQCVITIPLIFILVRAWLLSRKINNRGDKKALEFIAWSGFFKFIAFLSMAIDDFIAQDNAWSTPAGVFMILGFIYFYLGVARPKKVFERYNAIPEEK